MKFKDFLFTKSHTQEFLKEIHIHPFLRNDRSSHSEVFCEKGVLQNFCKNHGKTSVPKSLF